MRKFVGCSALVLGSLYLVGCGANTPAPPPEPTIPAAAVAPPPPLPPPPPEPELSPEAKELKQAMDRRPRPERHAAETVLSANEPEQLVVQFGQAVADKKYQVLWEMLPTPYQNDIKTLMTDFVAKVDGKVYNQLTSNVQLMVFTLRKHKDKFFRHPIMDHLPLDRATLEKVWDPAVAVGEAFLDSEMYDIQELQKIDFPRALAETGPRVMDQIPTLASALPMPELGEAIELIQSLKNVKATKISGDDSAQVVKIEIEGRDPIEAEFVKHEGKWIPRILQDNWTSGLEQARSALAMIPVDDGTEEGKKRVDRFRGLMIGLGFGATLLASVDTDARFDEYIRVIWDKAMNSPFPVPKEEAKPAEATADEAKPADAVPPAPEKK
ncbi:hypothetical protein K2X85_05620 [bacterium]|nr:hypothetical protein [bacterium]